MKCPDWLLNAMKEGKEVLCKVNGYTSCISISGFDGTDDSPFYSSQTNGWYDYAEPYIEPKHEFKPFDKVLVRVADTAKWHATFWFIAEHEGWAQCIPYEGNEHLYNTTNKETK